MFTLNSEAQCSHCCPDGEPIIQLLYSGFHEEGAHDVFTFTARPRCSSTRAHHNGAKLVMVVTGIPHLKDPLVSIPISINARARRRKVDPPSPEIVTKTESPVPSTPVLKDTTLTASTSPYPEKPLTVTDLEHSLLQFPFSYNGNPLLHFPKGIQQVARSAQDPLPPGVLATANLHADTLMNSPLSFIVNGSPRVVHSIFLFLSQIYFTL